MLLNCILLICIVRAYVVNKNATPERFPCAYSTHTHKKKYVPDVPQMNEDNSQNQKMYWNNWYEWKEVVTAYGFTIESHYLFEKKKQRKEYVPFVCMLNISFLIQYTHTHSYNHEYQYIDWRKFLYSWSPFSLHFCCLTWNLSNSFFSHHILVV